MVFLLEKRRRAVRNRHGVWCWCTDPKRPAEPNQRPPVDVNFLLAPGAYALTAETRTCSFT